MVARDLVTNAQAVVRHAQACLAVAWRAMTVRMLRAVAWQEMTVPMHLAAAWQAMAVRMHLAAAWQAMTVPPMQGIGSNRVLAMGRLRRS